MGSLKDDLCNELKIAEATAMNEEDPVMRFVIKSPKGEEDKFCYPWDEPGEVEVLGERPFKGGWCHTEWDPSLSDCSKDDDEFWGWCVEGCDEDKPRDFNENIHEIEVDAFVYENCSTNVDTFTEFCTGSPIVRPKQHNVRKTQEGDWLKISTDPETWHPADVGWNGNSTILRPASRYQGRQHNSVVGDACFGD